MVHKLKKRKKLIKAKSIKILLPFDKVIDKYGDRYISAEKALYEYKHIGERIAY
jgi:hypothetical protein